MLFELLWLFVLLFAKTVTPYGFEIPGSSLNCARDLDCLLAQAKTKPPRSGFFCFSLPILAPMP